METNSNSDLITPKKITILDLAGRKKAGQKISMITAYDHPTARMVDSAGIDCILVGDSLGMVVMGYENTLPVTMGDMLHHCKAVSRGAKHAFLVGDMPFLSYQISLSEAIQNAGRFLAEGGMDAVKLEGGRERVDVIRAIVDVGIPVMGHLGLTPQSIQKLGGFRPRGKDAKEAARIIEDAKALQESGCFALVLESVPTEVAAIITNMLEIPVIGIGAGNKCDGQVLVLHDALGLTDTYQPKFTKKFVNTYDLMKEGVRSYISEVVSGEFPGNAQTVFMDPDEIKELSALLH